MNVQGKEEERPKLERFDGTQPATYRKWRRKAELMLLALPTTYSKDRWGAKLMEFLSGEAEEVCEGIALEKIIKEGGHEIIFETLDGRYKDLQKDALQKHLTEYFYGTSIKAGESYRNMTIRLETAYRRLQEHKVELPDEVRGWFLLRKLQLESQAEAMVLTHTRGSLKYADVNSAAQAIFPQGCAKTGGGKSREVFETELLEEPGKTNQETDELDGDDVFQVIADQIQSQETYDDEEAIEVFESYQDIRRKMQQKKMARGYKATGTGSTWTLSGTVRGKIEQLKARSRCHICQERGHWKRECPKRKPGGAQQASGKQSQASAKTSQTSEAMIMDSGGGSAMDNLNQEYFLEAEDIVKLDTFLAEQCGQREGGPAGLDVLHADGEEVTGDLGQSVFEFFQKQGHASGSEAYMADLATHGVPDTACRRTLIGEAVLQRMSEVLGRVGLQVLFVRERHEFKFGNAGLIQTDRAAIIPVRLGSRQLAIKAAVLPGSGSEAPLLLSKELLRGLGATLDMGSDTVDITKCGVKLKLHETERGHYAIPLFEGMGIHGKREVTQNQDVKTHVRDDAEIFGSQKSPPVAVHLAEGDQRHELSEHRCGDAGREQLRSDPSDCRLDCRGAAAVGGAGPGGAECVDPGSTIRSRRRRARRARARANRANHLQRREVSESRRSGELCDVLSHRQELRGVGAEVREVRPRCSGEVIASDNDTVPTVRGLERSAQVAENPERVGARTSADNTESHNESSDRNELGSIPQGEEQSKAEAIAHNKAYSYIESKPPECRQGRCDGARDRACGDSLVADATSRGDKDVVHGEREAPPVADESDRGPAPRAGAPERGGPGLADGEVSEPKRMSQGERKLCRRGIARCKDFESGVCVVQGGMDVLLLEGSEKLSMITAVGLSSDYIFAQGELSSSSLSLGDCVSHAIEKIRQCRPQMLVIRTPKCLSGGVHKHSKQLVHASQRQCAFTRLVAACCSEQLCEGRLFCVWDESGILQSGVKRWCKVVAETEVYSMKIGTSGSVHTNSKEIRPRMRQGETQKHNTEADDAASTCMKCVAVALLDRKRARLEVHASHCVFTIEELRESGEESEKKVMSLLRKCHENLGHPSPARLVMLLKSAHASERVLKLARGLECETCSALSRPKSHNVTKMRRATEFNQQVCIDTFELDVRHAKVHFLNIVDEATGFQMCTPLWKGMQARHVRNAYRKSWKRWAGPPVRLFCDGGKEFEGEFEHGLSLDGTFSDASAAYAPWQNGLVERKGAVWKAAYSKAQMETYPRSKQETQELIDQVNNAVNSMSRVEGFSPFQHVFGRDLRVPGMISSDYDPVINSSLAQGESVFERRMELRKAARRAFLDADAENKLRKAMEHRNRPERGPFSEGQLVYFWRKSRFETRHHWHGPAVVIGKSGSSKVWVAKGTKVYRCCPEQLRSLSPEQEAMIRLLPADMVHVRNEVSAKGAGNFYDLSMLDKPPDSHVEERSEQDERENAVAAPPMDLVSGHENAIASPPMQLESSPDQAVELAVLPEQRPRREDPRDDDAGDVSPSKKQRVEPEVTPLTRAMRASTELLDHGRRLSARAESSQRPSEIPVPEDDEDDLEVIVVEGQDHWVIDHSQSRLVRVHVVERCVPWSPSDHELPVRVEDVELVCQSVMYTRSGERHTRDYEWRNVMHESSTGVGKWTGQTVFQLKPGWSRQSASSIECFEVGATKKGRKEVIESELSQNQQAGLKKAKLKEWNKLLKSGAIVVHTGRKAAQLRKSVPRKRVLKSRFVVTEAEQGSHPDTCDLKARWCIRGYLDPDVLELDTSAPTLSAEGFAVAMQLIASHGWQLTIADVEGAFLRGDNLSPQRGRLFIDMPPGGIEGYDDQCLVEAIKTVYGLADAPKAWWNCFSGKLKDLNMQMSEFDPCVFYYYHSGRLEGVITLHVDDLCMGGSLKFQQSVQQPLRQMFPFKHWKTQQGEFLGKWLEQQSDGSIKISQEQYASSAKGIEISKERRREKSELVDESERQQMRAALGGINWLVSGSRPDLAAWCSLMQQRVNCACVSDLIEVNKLLSLARDHSKSYIWVKPIPVDSVQFSVLTDAAWANAQDHCSQAGYMIAACDSRLSAGQSLS